MKILVTGGAGYIGSTLVPHLLRMGHSVRVLDSLRYGGQSLLSVWSHPSFEIMRGDIRDPASVRCAVAGVDAVVHLAAIVGDPACARQPAEARAVNLDAPLALLDACRRASVSRFIFASTCSNYGKMQDADGYVTEDTALAPVSLYAETKVAVERAIPEHVADSHMESTILRFATVYGVSPRMRFDLTVNEFTADILLRQRLVVFGEQFWRPYIHVLDVARAIGEVLEAPAELVRSQVFNVGATDQNFQKRQLVELIRPQAPDAEVSYVHRQEDPRDYRVCFDKIGAALKYRTTRTVSDGIAEVAKLVRSGAIPDWESPLYRN
jgi:nucleoside-diphosphate-sugar epimerase